MTTSSFLFKTFHPKSHSFLFIFSNSDDISFEPIQKLFIYDLAKCDLSLSSDWSYMFMLLRMIYVKKLNLARHPSASYDLGKTYASP